MYNSTNIELISEEVSQVIILLGKEIKHSAWKYATQNTQH